MFCQEKDLDYEEIKDKLKGCGLPGFDKAVRLIVKAYVLYLAHKRLVN